MINFDITNKQKALESLATFLNCEPKLIDDYVQDHIKDYDASALLEYLNINVKDLAYDDLKLVGMHLTSNDDQCEFIKSHGLSNLYAVLLTDNSLTRYLSDHQIEFDLLEKKISYKGKWESLELSKYDLLKQKIYEDQVTHVFLRIGDFGYYSAKNQIRPEILTLLAQIYDDEELLSFWDISHQTYLIKFVEDIHHFDLSSLALSHNEKDVTLQLIFYAMDIIALDEQIELWCHLKSGYRVPNTNIIDIHSFYNN